MGRLRAAFLLLPALLLAAPAPASPYRTWAPPEPYGTYPPPDPYRAPGVFAPRTGPACFAGPHVCPLARGVQPGQPCSCPGPDGKPVWGYAGSS
jgi:hypothetical protein